MGINPGLRAVAVGAPFARRGNRFYPALRRAGITSRVIAASDGPTAADIAELTRSGIGITSLARRPTANAGELSITELRDGLPALRQLIGRVLPRVVAVMGVTGYRAAFQDPRAAVGHQPGGIEGAQLWVVPNPSGRNIRASLDDLARSYAEAAVAAGVMTMAARSSNQVAQHGRSTSTDALGNRVVRPAGRAPQL